MIRPPLRLFVIATVASGASVTTPRVIPSRVAADTSLLAGLRPRTIGPANVSGRIVDVAVNETDPYEFYVASATGGLWKTTDNGVTWAPVFEKEAVHSIGVVTVDQRRPSVVWVGTGEATNRQSSSWGDGVYKSTDAGRTWANVGLRDSRHIGRIVLDPRDGDVVYVAAAGHLWGPNPERGVFKSTDGGRTWSRILFIDENTGVIDLAIDPSDPNVLYAAAYQRRRQPFGFVGGGPGSGLYKSTDAGQTWRRLTTGLPGENLGRIGISVYRKDPRVVYASVEQGLRYTSSISYGARLGGVYRSDDKGESWRLMGDWNPRPAYSSQIRVDPSDQSRIYMVAYSVSDDSGKTFRSPRQTLHGDDRVVWVDPKDSRHLIKGDDGGVGISYDRGAKWLYVTALPVSQFYRLGVSNTRPFLVCGGLQDNGSWCGPSATYAREGVLNDDWFRVGGGDGFFNVVDTADNRTLYSSSQYLGITRVDLRTLESRNIRPTVKEGEGPKLGNWGSPDPKVGKKIPPAGWNAPFIISPHDHNTVYGGMRVLWRSADRGDTWTSLGDPTTGVDRRKLAIMGQSAVESALSLDDGVSYFPTISALAESPRVRGLLWVGTDDGNVQVSRDGGRAWTNVVKSIPGVPAGTWVSAVEPSRWNDSTVFVAFDGHQVDDYTNYLFRSTDNGRTWTSIVGDLPPGRVIHAVHEDPRNPRGLYVGTEFGLFVSVDGGRRWMPLAGGMPTVPVNDFLVHGRENDLVMATHGRGIWILDNVNALQELTPTVLASPSHLFTIEPAEMIRYASTKAHAGDLVFRGQNPPAGAIIDYYLREPAENVTIAVLDTMRHEIARLMPTKTVGINRVVWNLRYPALPAPPGEPGEDDAAADASLPGRWVEPGPYLVRLTANGRSQDRRLMVREDPRIDVVASVREQWSAALATIADVYLRSSRLADSARTVDERLRKGTASARERTEAADIAETARELQQRIAALYGNVLRVTATPTTDQRAQMGYFPLLMPALERRLRALSGGIS